MISRSNKINRSGRIFAIISVLLLMLMFVSAFCSCNNNKVPGPDTSSGESSEATEVTESQTDKPDDTPEMQLKASEIAKFRLVRQEKATDEVKNAVNTLYGAINEKFSVQIEYKDDFTRDDVPQLKEAEYEIIVGNCARKACEEVYANYKLNDYGCVIYGTKLLIGGLTDEGTIKAINYFVENVINKFSAGGGDVVFDNGMKYILKASYPVENIKINGTDIGEYSIVYPAKGTLSEKTIAEDLRNIIAERCGTYLAVKSDKEAYVSGKEIHIGATNRDSTYVSGLRLSDNAYVIGKNGDDFVVAYSGTAIGNVSAVKAIKNMLDKENDGKNLDVTINSDIIDKISDPMSVMSFNIKTTYPDDARRKRVIETIRMYLPDMVGIQEAAPHWMSMLREGLGSVYSFVGEGRDGGNVGEYNPIFYKKDKYELLESGTKWMSSTPDVKGSKYPTSSYPRIFTYAILKEKSTGEKFLYINTHFDHKSAEARKFQAGVLADFVSKNSEYRILLTGDFNCASTENTFGVIKSAGFKSSADVAFVKENLGATFHNYGSSSKVLDYCFLKGDGIYIGKYKVVKDKIDGEYPSDHFPLYVEFLFR